MADLFTAEQGKRLFGFIGAGGTAGALLGPLITIELSKPLGPINLLIAAAVLLELAVFCVYRLERAATVHAGQTARCTPRRSASAAAPLRLFSSSSARPICSASGCGSACCRSAPRSSISSRPISCRPPSMTRDAQTRIFAGIDLAVNLLSLATQVFITGQVLKRFGTGIAAGALPAVYVVGFAALFLAPTLAVVVTLQVVQRWMNFAIANPARQVFFTVIGREEKYKAKNLIDVVVYRGSDALYGWVFDSLQALGLKLGAIALVALPAAAGWLVLSMVLGRAQEHRAALIDSEAAKPRRDARRRKLCANLGDADISVASEGDAMTGERA